MAASFPMSLLGILAVVREGSMMEASGLPPKPATMTSSGMDIPLAFKAAISWMARKLQHIADNHRCGFLIVVFGIVLLCFVFNICRMVNSYKAGAGRKGVAVERVDSALQKKNVHVHELPADYENYYKKTGHEEY